jgi:hypothetical protein
MRRIFNADNLDLSNFPKLRVAYLPHGYETKAVQVTRDTIGGLAMECGTDVFTSHSNNAWITILVERTRDDDQKYHQEKTFKLTDWIVLIRGEVHKFENDIFWSTFASMDQEAPAHSIMPEEKASGTLESNIFGQDFGPGPIEPFPTIQ